MIQNVTINDTNLKFVKQFTNLSEKITNVGTDYERCQGGKEEDAMKDCTSKKRILQFMSMFSCKEIHRKSIFKIQTFSEEGF